LLGHLRSALLLRAAAAAGASRLASGETATALAVRAVADLCKGRGFSLPGDQQPHDARWGGAAPAALRAMREVTAKECALLCRFRGLPLADAPPALLHAAPRDSVNQLAATFMEGVTAGMPSALFTVLRTTAGLAAFDFNASEGFSGRREWRQRESAAAEIAAGGGGGGGGGGLPHRVYAPSALPLCAVCSAPCPAAGLSSAAEAGDGGAAATASPAAGGPAPGPPDGRVVCYDCRTHILAPYDGGGDALAERMAVLWPARPV
jgi:hypothetical protein